MKSNSNGDSVVICDSEMFLDIIAYMGIFGLILSVVI